MSGTIGFLWDTDDGYSFAILANTRPDDDGCAWTGRGMMEDILYDVSEWPKYDLFTGSQKELKPIIVNPGLGTLPNDLVFKSPVILPELPKFEVIDLGDDQTPGRAPIFDLPILKRPATTAVPHIHTELVPQRGGQALTLSFPTEDGWEYSVERSRDGQNWISETLKPSRTRTGYYTVPTSEQMELFRVNVQPESATRGDDPTDPPRATIVGNLRIAR
jgi:hypothetical protein